MIDSVGTIIKCDYFMYLPPGNTAEIFCINQYVCNTANDQVSHCFLQHLVLVIFLSHLIAALWICIDLFY